MATQQDQQDTRQHEGAGQQDPHQQQPAPNAHDDHNPQTQGQTRGQKPGARK